MMAGNAQTRVAEVVVLFLAFAGSGRAAEPPAEDKTLPVKPDPAPAVPALSPRPPEGGCPPLALDCHCDAAPGGFFVDGEYLYLKPRRDAFDFAVLSPTSNIATGTVESLSWRWESGLRAGGGYRLGQGWEVDATYTYLHSNANQSLSRPTAQGTIFATLTHPGLIEQADTALGTSGFKYNVIDGEFARRFEVGDSSEVRVFGGGRFAWIDQSLDAFYDGGDARSAHVSSPIDFQGAGIRAGGEACWKMPWGFSVFARGSGSLLVGDFHTSLLETNNGGATTNVNVSRGFEKMVPVAELAAGLTWQYRNLRMSGGYELTNWFGLVDSPDFVDDVHQGKLSRRGGDLSLEGFAFRVMMNF